MLVAQFITLVDIPGLDSQSSNDCQSAGILTPLAILIAVSLSSEHQTLRQIAVARAAAYRRADKDSNALKFQLAAKISLLYVTC